MMRVLRLLCGLAAAAATAVRAAPSISLLEQRQAAGFPAPSVDWFYKAPSNLANYPLGQPIRTRDVPQTRIGNTNSTARVFQLLYRTQNAAGQPDATVVTVFVPKAPVTPKKILSYQLWEDSTRMDCSPSWALVANSQTVNAGIVQWDAQTVIPWGTDNGWYVIVPDNLGTASAFLSGYQEGRATLDGIRAAGWYLGMSTKTDVAALAGYSGGAHSTAWAAHLAGSYAPDLNIVGAVYGGTPLDVRLQIDMLNNTGYSHYNVLSLVGLSQAYSDFNTVIRASLSSFGQQLFQQAFAAGICIYTIPNSWKWTSFSSYFTNNMAPLNSTVVQRVFAMESLLQSAASVIGRKVGAPSIPVYVYHGTEDQIAPYSSVQQYVGEVCAAGGRVRFTSYPGTDHFSAQGAGTNAAGSWLWQTLMYGAPPNSKCGASS